MQAAMIFLVHLGCIFPLVVGDGLGQVHAAASVRVGRNMGARVASTNNTTDDDTDADGEAAAIEPSASQALWFMWQSVKTQLENPQLQGAKGLLALVLGSVMLYEGQMMFKIFVVIFSVIFFFFLTVNELEHTEAFESYAVKIISGLEVGCAAGWVVWKGYPGFKYLLGAGAGAWVGHNIITFFVHHKLDLFTGGPGWVALITLNVPILLGMWLFGDSTHARLMAIFSAVYGGSMVSASLLFFAQYFVTSQTQMISDNLDVEFEDKTIPWVTFFLMLWNWTKAPVGVFSSMIPDGEDKPDANNMDRLIGVVLWTVLSVVGYWCQSKSLSPQQGKVASRKEASSEGRSNRQPLLK